MESNLNIEIKDFNGPLDVLLDLVHNCLLYTSDAADE